MSMFRPKSAVIALTGLAIGLSACGGPSASTDDTLAIGVIRPHSGALAQYGAHYSNGVNMAIKEVNAAGGIDINGTKVKVKAEFCDSEGDSAQAATCGRKLATEKSTPVVLTSLSTEAFPVLAFNDSDRSPFVVIAGSASNKLVTEGNTKVARYWFNSYKYMPGFTELLAEQLDSVKGGKNVAIMQSEDEYGKSWNDTFTKAWKNAGGNITATATFAPGTTDVYPQITALLKNKPDVVATPGACPTVVPAVKQARELGFKGRFIFAASCTPAEMVAAVGEDAIKGSIFEGTAWDFSTDAIEKFKQDFKAEYKTDPVILDAVAYAHAMWAIRSAEKAGDVTDASKIRAAMPETLDADWNFLALSDMESSGETSAPIHPRLYESADKIVDYTGKS